MPYYKSIKTQNSSQSQTQSDDPTPDYRPEMRLMAAVIACAFQDYASKVKRDYSGPYITRTQNLTAIRDEARDWFLYDFKDDGEEDWPFSLKNICRHTRRKQATYRNTIKNMEALHERH